MERSRWSTRAIVTAVGVALLVVAAIGVAVLRTGDVAGDVAVPEAPAPPAPTPPPRAPSEPVRPVVPTPRVAPGPVGFDGVTGTVLVFDDGLSGALALDLDTGDQQRIELRGQRPGDQPYRLHRMGSWLVVGVGEIWAVAPGSDQPPRSLGEATIFLPAAEADQLWFIDHAGASGFTATLVDPSGEELHQAVLEGDVQPIRGVPGGLALRREDGALVVYDLAEGRVRSYLAGSEPTRLGAVTRDRVVWCDEDPCRRLRLSDGTGELVTTIGSGEAAFDVAETWLSPDGSRLAAVVWVPVDGGVDRRLRIHRTEDGGLLADTQLPLGEARGDWTVDGAQFLSWLNLPGTDGAPALLGRWAGGGEIELVDVSSLGLSGLHGFVALPREPVAGLFAALANGCPVSPESDAMGPLPAWRGDRVHVALPRSAPADVPDQLWVGIPGAGSSTAFTLSADRLDGPGLARFHRGVGEPWTSRLDVAGGVRSASGYPPHWGLAAAFSDPGCWAVSVTTDDGVSDTVVIDLTFDER